MTADMSANSPQQHHHQPHPQSLSVLVHSLTRATLATLTALSTPAAAPTPPVAARPARCSLPCMATLSPLISLSCVVPLATLARRGPPAAAPAAPASTPPAAAPATPALMLSTILLVELPTLPAACGHVAIGVTTAAAPTPPAQHSTPAAQQGMW
jgi:hypothetical protein